MAKVAITEQYLTDIADAIRSKTGMSSATYYPSEMADAIMTISGSGGITPTGTINITTNNTYDVTRYASAVVNVPVGSTINNQDKSVAPTESSQEVTYDDGYTGLGTVIVGAISSTYVGSGITRNPTPTASGATVTIPAGYYSAQTSKAVSTATHAEPTASINSETGLITASHTQAAGYVSAGTTTDTLQLTTQAAATITPSTSSQTAVAAGKYTLGAVTVAAVPTETKTVTVNGDVTPSTGKFLSKVTVNVPTGGTVNNQNKSVTPTESQQSVTADSGYTGLGTVTVDAISSTYVGSGITRRTSDDLAGALNTSTYDITVPAGYYASDGTFSIVRRSASNLVTSVDSGYLKLTYDNGYYPGGGKNLVEVKSSTNLTVSGDTVTAPAGYYASAASKSVSSMTLPTSTASSATSGYTSKAIIGRSTSAQYINIPPGYNSAGAYYEISAVANGSATGPTSLSGSSATVTTGTNTITLTKTGVTTTPTVNAGYVSSATASTATVALTASVTTKAAATYTPGTTNQTIAAGTYLTGTQTIAGDEDLVASNIVSGVQIFGVTGNVVLQNYYTGSSAPSSSTGSNGDLYLQS